MIVGIDGRSLGGVRGIARSTRELATALAARPDLTVRALVPGRGAVAPDAGVALSRTRVPSRALHGWAAVMGRPEIRARLGADVVWLPAPAPAAPGSPYVLTVHDLSWIERPQDFTPYERAWHRAIRLPRLLHRAAGVVAVSAPVADAVRERFGVHATVIEPGVRIPADVTPEDRPRPYVLYVGALEPRKGLDVLERAWRIAEPDADLLLAGEGRVRPGVGERLGAVSDERLHALYAGAAALVLPSRLEGYGLPPREAAAHGVPSIVSDLPALRMPGTLRVPPGDAAALAQALTSLPAERARLVAELAPPRSWETAAAELDAVLAEAAG